MPSRHELAAMIGGMQVAVNEQGTSLKATMKEGEIAHAKSQEVLVGAVKE